MERVFDWGRDRISLILELHRKRKPEAPSARPLFQLVPENKKVPKTKNKLHLDLRVGAEDVDAVVARLKERGAKFLWNGQQGPHTWVTMADPEGNEFCVSE